MRLGVFACVFSLLSMAVSMGFAQDAQPIPVCADVDPDGSVDLSWVDATNAGPGSAYEIFRDQGVGFQSVGTVNFPATTFNDGASGALSTSVDYFVQLMGSPTDLVKDTISTIFLELIPSGSSSVAQLEWNFPFDPMPVGGEFVIERSIESEPFGFVTTLPPGTNSYLDTLYFLDAAKCDSTLYTYQVGFLSSDCQMFSQQVFDKFIDLEGPPQPDIETITVDPLTNDVTINWADLGTPDLEQYVIQQIDDNFITVGTEPAGSTQFTLSGAGGQGPITLGVRSEDICGNENSFDEQFTTIFTEAIYEECQLDATIIWTNYDGWDEGVEAYEIRAYVDGADELIETVPPDGFIYNAEVVPNTEYRFYVRAISGGGHIPSSSNGVLIQTEYPVVSEIPYQSSVSTNLSGQIEVKLAQDLNGVGTTYELYRAEGEGTFGLIATFESSSEDTIAFLDTDVRPDDLVYTYYWRAYDGCGQPIGDSNEGNNIVLETRSNKDDLVNRVAWNAYIGWDGDVMEYQILRSLGAADEFQFFDVLDPNELDWSEDVESFMMDEGRFCYRIMAVEDNNQFGEGAVSYSNVSCITQEPLVWIPSAMVFEGFNDSFKPVLGFIDFDTYRMEIYNKWGERLFNTKEAEDGWDGTYRGGVVPEDYYRYIISFRDGAGKPFVEEGTLYMIRNAD